MLIVTRRVGETVVITLPSGETVKVVVIAVRGSQVSIGTSAPPHIAVDRQEIHERKQRERLERRGSAQGRAAHG